MLSREPAVSQVVSDRQKVDRKRAVFNKEPMALSCKRTENRTVWLIMCPPLPCTPVSTVCLLDTTWCYLLGLLPSCLEVNRNTLIFFSFSPPRQKRTLHTSAPPTSLPPSRSTLLCLVLTGPVLVQSYDREHPKARKGACVCVCVWGCASRPVL